MWIALPGLLAALIMLGLGACSHGSLAAALLLMLAPWLAWSRQRWVPVVWWAEWEMLLAGICVLLFALIAGMDWQRGIFFTPGGPYASRLTAVLLTVTLWSFSVFNGSRIVRGILAKARIHPVPETSEEVSRKRERYGEVIGLVERSIVFLLVIAGSLPTLAFFFAAKGLVRSKELEERRMADYFLLGSLSSFLLALAAALLARLLLASLWN